MYKPAGIRASHAKMSTPAKQRISATLITFFVLIHLAFAQNCGFIKLFNKKFQYVLKLASLCLTFWVVIVNTMPLLVPQTYAEPGSWNAILTLLECVGYILILEFAKTSVYEFLIKVNFLCGSKDGNGKETLGVLVLVYAFILVFTKLSSFVLICLSIGKEFCEAYFVFLPTAVPVIYSLCTDFVPIILTIIAYHKLRCVLHLRQFLRKTEIDVDATKKLYFAVANLFDDIGPLYLNLELGKFPAEVLQSNLGFRKMYKPAGLHRNYKLIAAKRQISKTLAAFFIMIQFIFGLNCDFIKWFDKKFHCYLKFASLCVSFWVLLMNLILVLVEENYYLPRAWYRFLTLYHCVADILILQFSDTSVYDFLAKSNLVSGTKYNENCKSALGTAAFVYTSVFCLSKTLILANFCLTVGREFCNINVMFIPFIIPAVYSWCLDFVPIIMAIINCHELRCVMSIRQSLKKPEIDVEVTKKLYIDVANIFDYIRPLYHNLLMVTLTAELPKLLITMHYMLKFIKLQTGLATFTSEFIYIAHGIIQISMPAIIAERVKCEIEQIKLELHSHIMAREDDVRLRDRVHNLLGYMEARRLQRRAWRFVPTDLRLPIALWGLCTTYFILLLQFSHLIE